jgi:hypothetical protein
MLIPVLIVVLFPDSLPAHIVAQAATDAGPWLTALNIGLAGIGLWAFTTGRIHSDKELQRVIARCDAEFQRIAGKLDAAEAELRERNREARETLVPTLVKATDLFARYLDRRDNTPPPPPKGDR